MKLVFRFGNNNLPNLVRNNATELFLHYLKENISINSDPTIGQEIRNNRGKLQHSLFGLCFRWLRM